MICPQRRTEEVRKSNVDTDCADHVDCAKAEHGQFCVAAYSRERPHTRRLTKQEHREEADSQKSGLSVREYVDGKAGAE